MLQNLNTSIFGPSHQTPHNWLTIQWPPCEMNHDKVQMIWLDAVGPGLNLSFVSIPYFPVLVSIFGRIAADKIIFFPRRGGIFRSLDFSLAKNEAQLTYWSDGQLIGGADLKVSWQIFHHLWRVKLARPSRVNKNGSFFSITYQEWRSFHKTPPNTQRNRSKMGILVLFLYWFNFPS